MQKQHKLFQTELTNYQDFCDFEHKINQLAETMRIDLADYQIDHLALRVNTEQSARNWLELLMKCGTILRDNLVNGRVIYLIQLAQPVQFAGQLVEIIELPFPKNKTYPLESWEHIEIVLPFQAGENSEQWASRIEQQFLWNQSQRLKVKCSEPKVQGERLPNPSIAVSFADKSTNNVSIKVHPYHIKTIIEV